MYMYMLQESCGKPAQSPLIECITTMAATASMTGITLKFNSYTSSSSSQVMYQVEGRRESGEPVSSGTLFRLMASFDEVSYSTMTSMMSSPHE